MTPSRLEPSKALSGFALKMEGLRRPAVDSASPQPDPEKQSAEAECRSLCDAQLSDIIMSFGLKHGVLALCFLACCARDVSARGFETLQEATCSQRESGSGSS